MQKWKRSYEKSRRYNPKWQDDFSWLSQASNGKAFCEICQCCVAPKYSNLTQHENTEKHKRRASEGNNSLPKTSDWHERVVTKPYRNKMEVNELNERNQDMESKDIDDEEEADQEEDITPKEIDEEYSAAPLAKEKQEPMQFDTTEEFAEVFGSKLEFDSWDEFTKLLEEFQMKTGTSFKPRSACSVDYANERRINGPIPERFVYSNVKMICHNFGTSHKRGSGQRRSYVGLGCGAFMNVSYNRGALRITQSVHVHSNHEPDFEHEQTPQRHLRAFNFTEELDLITAREVLRSNPFEFANGEKQWVQAVERLKEYDDFSGITPRLVKKRIRFLVDKFLAISHGRQPPSEDEMGCILYQLHKTKKETMDPPVGRGRKRRGPGRPRIKRSYSEEDDLEEEEVIGDSAGSTKKRQRLSQFSTESSSSSEISTLLSYLKRKDEDDRTLRQKEIDLRREELSFQKQRFEFERVERKAHLDLLKAQLQAFEHGMATKQATAVTAKDANQVTEYTIVVDNNNQVLESMPTLG